MTVEFDHRSVLLQECVSALTERPAGFIADVTGGGGGHSAGLLDALGSAGRMLCLDRDELAVRRLRERFAASGDRVMVVHAPFSELATVVREMRLPPLDGVLADLGVSSPQLDLPARGFSLRESGPLDMRMDTSQGLTAREVIEDCDERSLADLIYKYGEERRSRPIARSILRALEEGKLESTGDLRAAVVRVTGPKRGRIDPATRTFQALRIAVNDELGELRTLLSTLPEVLADGGVAAIISFHSLEDRMVKHTFREDPRMLPLVKRPIVAGEAEQAQNPRARSAKLRVARRVPRAGEEVR